MVGVTDTFSLLARVHHPIHSTVTSLHANAEVPHIDFIQESSQRVQLIYRSPRPLADIAHGLIDGAIAHFEESIGVERSDMATDGVRSGTTCFTLTKTTAQ